MAGFVVDRREYQQRRSYRSSTVWIEDVDMIIYALRLKPLLSAAGDGRQRKFDG